MTSPDPPRSEGEGFDFIPPPPPGAPSASTPDWDRERVRRGAWEPSRRLLRAIRCHQYWAARRGLAALVMRKSWALRHRFWSAVTGADIPVNCRIDGGLLLPHPNGIVIHPEATIGPNCLIFQGVTVGLLHESRWAPRIAGGVDLGAGAKVLGEVRIGAYARVGANAVVLRDVPPGATAVGVPARIIPRADLVGSDPPAAG